MVYDLLSETQYGYVLAENFNVEFMMEALIIKQPLNSIRKQLEFVIKVAISAQRWELIQSIFCAIRTFEQFQKTVNWNDDVYRENRRFRYLYKSEIINRIEVEYNASVLNEIIKDAFDLHRLGELNRVKGIISNHFKNKSFTVISKTFVGDDNQNFLLNESKQRLIFDFGRICRYCEFSLDIEKDISSFDKNELFFLEYYLNGWFEASTDFENIDLESTIPENFIIPTGEVFFKFLNVLAKENYWTYLFKVIDSLVITEFNRPIILQIGVWYIQHCKLEQLKVIKNIILKDNFECLKGMRWKDEYPTEYKLKAYCNLFFLLGYNKKECLNIDNVINEYYIHLEYSEKDLLRTILKINFKIGYYFNLESDKSSFELEYKVILESLLNWKGRYTSHMSMSEVLSDILLKMISLGEAYEESNFQGIVFQIFKDKINLLSNEGAWDYSLSPILISFLQKRGEQKTLITYLKNVSDTKGHLWRLSIDERRYILKDVLKCCNNLNMDNKYLDFIKEWDQWFSVGYSGHKEYILFDLLEWLKLLFERDSKKWKAYFSDVMQISEIINRFADNRIGLELDILFSVAAIKESISAVGDIFNSRHIYIKDKVYVLSELFQKLLADNSIKLKDTIVLWNFIYNSLHGDSYTDKDELSKLKDAIIDYLKKNNYPNEMLDSYLCINEVNYYSLYTSICDVKQEDCVCETYQDYITYIEELFSNEKTVWKECCTFIKLLKVNRPKNTNEYINRIINLLITRKKSYEWRADGVYDVYKAIFQFIDEDIEWLLLEKNIEKLENEISISRWVYLIGDVILNTCLLHAESFSIEEIENVVRAIIDMHIRFISGNYRFNYIKDNILIKGNKLETWEELIQELN